MFLLNQVVACSESDEMCVVGRCGDGDAARAADVGVAQLVGQHLQLVGVEVVIVPQHMIMRRARRALSQQAPHCRNK